MKRKKQKMNNENALDNDNFYDCCYNIKVCNMTSVMLRTLILQT